MITDVKPTVDYAFKHLFGREATKILLIDLLNSTLNPAPGHLIREVDLLNPFNPKESFDDKLSILDIKARDERDRLFNIEMQMLSFRQYPKRILFYWSKNYPQQLQAGKDYLVLKPTISISFLDHVLFPEVPDYHLHFRLLEVTHHFPLTEDIEFHILELPKFKKSVGELSSGLDLWLYFLRNAEKMDREALADPLKSPMIIRALEELEMLSKSDLEREQYESRLMAQLDYNTGMKEARMEGIAEGRSEGRTEGRTEGRSEGRTEGRSEQLIDTIGVFERILNRQETPAKQLAALSLDELKRRADELKNELLPPR